MKQTRTLVEISLLVALAFVLDLFAGMYSRFIWQQGGAISAALVPMAIISYRHGAKLGMAGGLIFGVLQLIVGVMILNPVQALLDFLLPFVGACGILGLWSERMNRPDGKIGLSLWLSLLLASAFRFVSHWLSGVLFFYMFAPEGMNIWLYSFVYNFPQEFFNWLLAGVLLTVLLKRYGFATASWKKATYIEG